MDVNARDRLEGGVLSAAVAMTGALSVLVAAHAAADGVEPASGESSLFSGPILQSVLGEGATVSWTIIPYAEPTARLPISRSVVDSQGKPTAIREISNRTVRRAVHEMGLRSVGGSTAKRRSQT